MELKKKLRARSLKRALLPAIALMICGVIVLALSEFWLLIQKPVNLYDVPRRELYGKYVTVEVPYIYTSYAYSEEYRNNRATGTITSCEYIIDANQYDYCGLYLPKDLVAKGDALEEKSESYLYGDIDDEELLGYSFRVTGIMKAMPSDSLDYYYEAIGFQNMTADQQDLFLPLYLEARSSSALTTTWLLLVFGLVLLGAGVVILVKAASGGDQKQFMQKAEELSPGNPEYILAHAEQLYDMAPSVGGLRMNASLILIEQGRRHYLYGTKDLVWAYQNTVQHKTNGIPTGRSYHLILRMADGSSRDLAMREEQVKEQLQKIRALVPGCALGYSQELADLYQKDRPALRNIAAAQRASRGPEAQEEAETPAAPAADAPAEGNPAPEPQTAPDAGEQTPEA